ncbi:hypothetical protein [Natronomonas sp. LN261]|jgi:hypothetical protein|uniref:hypothetical protein n=1 Tax=Natronomonas sp. LN261 TaxID=2750669 RepID=UPI0015EE508D|nr:hypothetical protein [Natronomonas sp. LN261]
MSAHPDPQTDGLAGARVLDISGLPITQVEGYAAAADGVHFERRGGRTFLVTDG